MRNLIALARHLRATIEQLAATLEDDVAAENVELFPNWSGESVSYVTGDRVKYNGFLYKVLMNHTSQAEWTPESAPSLFAKVLIPDPSAIPVWEQPDSTNGYMIGDKVHYPTINDPVYESLIDNNVFSPEAYPAGWQLVDDEDEDEPTEPEEPDEPTEPDEPVEPDEPTEPDEPVEPSGNEDEIPEWVQPDSTNPYMTGDIVTHNDKVWICTVDNCVWEPGVYGWDEVTE